MSTTTTSKPQTLEKSVKVRVKELKYTYERLYDFHHRIFEGKLALADAPDDIQEHYVYLIDDEVVDEDYNGMVDDAEVQIKWWAKFHQNDFLLMANVFECVLAGDFVTAKKHLGALDTSPRECVFGFLQFEPSLVNALFKKY